MGTMRFTQCAWIAGCAILVTLQAKGDSTDREIARTFADAHLAMGDASSAEQVLSRHLATDPGDAGGWHLRGLARLRAGNYGEAAEDFGRAQSAASAQNRGIHLYYQGMALARSGNRGAAERALLAAAEQPVSASSSRRALWALRNSETIEEPVPSYPGKGAFRLSLNSGYDSNVLIRSDAAVAATTATGAASPRFLLTALGSYAKNGIGGGTLTTSGGLAYDFHSVRAVRVFDSLSVRAQAGLAGRIHRVSNAISATYLNRSGLGFYSWTDTLRWSGRVQLGYGSTLALEVPIQYQKFTVQTGDLAINDRSGPVFGAGAIYLFERETDSWSAGVRVERQLSSGDNFKATSGFLPLKWTRSDLPWDLEAAIGFTPGRILYTLATNGRNDTSLEGSASLGRSFRERLRGSLEYGLVRNLSNVVAATYLKHFIGIKVIYALY